MSSECTEHMEPVVIVVGAEPTSHVRLELAHTTCCTAMPLIARHIGVLPLLLPPLSKGSKEED
jgi:hypothetical protein